MSLYFVAITPEEKLSEEIRLIQQDFAIRLNSLKAYQSFPHITIVPPFSFNESKEAEIISKFENLAIKTSPFTLRLCGFGASSNKKNLAFTQNVMNRKTSSNCIRKSAKISCHFIRILRWHTEIYLLKILKKGGWSMLPKCLKPTLE